MSEYRNRYGLTLRQERRNKAVAALVVSGTAIAVTLWLLVQIGGGL